MKLKNFSEKYLEQDRAHGELVETIVDLMGANGMSFEEACAVVNRDHRAAVLTFMVLSDEVGASFSWKPRTLPVDAVDITDHYSLNLMFPKEYILKRVKETREALEAAIPKFNALMERKIAAGLSTPEAYQAVCEEYPQLAEDYLGAYNWGKGLPRPRKQ